MNTHTQRIKIQNAHSYPLTIHLEPWGEEIPIAAGVTYELVSEGPAGNCLLLSIEKRRTVVWGWSGSVISVFCDGTLLRTCDVPVPTTPIPMPDVPRSPKGDEMVGVTSR